MIKEFHGKVVKGLGGLYEIRTVEDGAVRTFSCRAKGALHREDEKVLIGDDVLLQVDDGVQGSVVIAKRLERRNALIRPPMANLDLLFIVFAPRDPMPVPETLDKLIAIAEYNRITPVILLTKSDLDPDGADALAAIYRAIGYDVFVTSSEREEGLAPLKAFIGAHLHSGVTAAFAGASGVGKSTLMNALFPELSLATAEISQKIARGKHTTRHVELFPMSERADAGFLADTPGFSLIDFERFDFFSLDDLLPTFRELLPYVGKCRYADCAHVGEGSADCAVARAEMEGKLAPSRLSSYRSLWRTLKAKNTYK